MTLYDKSGNLSNILFNSYFLYGVTVTHEDETPLLFQELDREVGQFKLPFSWSIHHDVATLYVAPLPVRMLFQEAVVAVP